MDKDDKIFEIRSIAEAVKSQGENWNGFWIDDLEKIGLKDKLVGIHFGELGYYKCAFVDGFDKHGQKINAVIQGSRSVLGDCVLSPVPVFIMGGHPVADGVISTIAAMGYIGEYTSLEIYVEGKPGYFMTPTVSRVTFQDDPVEVARFRDYALPLHQSRIRACKFKKDLSSWVYKNIPKVAGLFGKLSNTYVGDGILRVMDKLVNKE